MMTHTDTNLETEFREPEQLVEWKIVFWAKVNCFRSNPHNEKTMQKLVSLRMSIKLS